MKNQLPPATESHDVTVRLARLLKKGPTEPMELDEEGTKAFKAWLLGYLKAPNVASTAKVIAELVYFFHEKEGCPGVAQTLLKVSDAVFADLDKRGIDTRVARSALESAGQKFGNFMGTSSALSAPRMGEAPPAGTFKAGTLPRPMRRG